MKTLHLTGTCPWGSSGRRGCLTVGCACHAAVRVPVAELLGRGPASRHEFHSHTTREEATRLPTRPLQSQWRKQQGVAQSQAAQKGQSASSFPKGKQRPSSRFWRSAGDCFRECHP